MQTLDIGSLITEHLTQQPDRKSHGGLTVSDVANNCARAVWWSLHRSVHKEFDGPTRKKFEYGYALEKVVQNALEAKGYEVLPPIVIIFRNGFAGPHEISLIPAEMYDKAPEKYALPEDVVGHPDILARKKPVDVDTENILIEVKSTMLFRNGNRPPEHPQPSELLERNGNYVLQGAAYAKGVGATKFAVYVSDRGTGIDRTYWFDTEREYPAFLARLEEMKPALNPDVEPEPTLPSWTRSARGTSYLCKGCPVVSCANNLGSTDFKKRTTLPPSIQKDIDTDYYDYNKYHQTE